MTRSGATTSALSVTYTLGGTAIPGVDFVAPLSPLTIPAGASSAAVEVRPLSGSRPEGTRSTVVFAVSAETGYVTGPAATATGTLVAESGSLFVSSLRVPASAIGTTATGSASIRLNAEGTAATVSVNFFGLSSEQTVAYLRLGQVTETGTELLRLPNGQVGGLVWTLRSSGTLTIPDILAALADGRVFVSIQTVNFPGGEVLGSFVRATGSSAFVPPAPPPALPSTVLSTTEAARFLTQASFGPTTAEINALAGQPRTALDTWITQQMALPTVRHLDATRDDFNVFVAPGGQTSVSSSSRHAAWWRIALKSPDQLRQRVAFALSQILVVSEYNDTLSGQQEALAAYYDLLARNAFGNFRQLLEEVTLSPVMGTYLSHLRNARARFNSQGVQITFPDENFAREIMQLFTVGINHLHPDGSLVLNAAGAPVPVYDQATITETAKVFTGWGFYSTATNPSFTGSASNYFAPMMLYPSQHDVGAKTIIGGRILPANQGGAQDLRDTLDALFNHPNTAPFISRQLIQRLVTSNPSPGYIYRVAQVFSNNGTGVRGDLGAVVRAILTDYEARSAAVSEVPTFGKLREPVLRLAALLRSLGADSNSGRTAISGDSADTNLAQAPLRSPTVFNFFEPGYVYPGRLAEAGLVAPEFQILTDNTAIRVPNYLRGFIYANRPAATDTASQTVGFRFDPALLALTGETASLMQDLNLRLAGNGLSPTSLQRIRSALEAMPAATTDANRLERLRSAIYLTLVTQAGAVQR